MLSRFSRSNITPSLFVSSCITHHSTNPAAAALVRSTALFSTARRNHHCVDKTLQDDVRRLTETVGALQEQLNAVTQVVAAQQHHQPSSQSLSSSVAAVPVAADAAADAGVLSVRTLNAVVKIFCTVSGNNYLLPWQRKQQTTATGSGFVVDKKRRLLMTNAHVVVSSTFVEVRRHGGSTKFTAQIMFVSADCDLALITVEEDAFWEDLEELDVNGVESGGGITAIAAMADKFFGGLPNLQQNVKVVGYPWGGDQMSITSGVVSRIDSSPYCGIDGYLLAVQIDAAINPGNSGGPALSDNRVVGVAFQTLMQGDNIGYIVPIPVVAHFLREYLHMLATHNSTQRYTAGHYHRGFCVLGAQTQEIHNDSLKKFVGLKPSQDGVLLQRILPCSASTGRVRDMDVVLAVNGHAVGSDAMFQWRGSERVRFSHLFQMMSVGDKVDLTLLREGKELNVEAEMGVTPQLVPNHLLTAKYLERPPYYIFGGCVFTTLCFPFLAEWGSNDWYNNAPRHLINYVTGGFATEQREEIVILLHVLPHTVNKGYSADSLSFRVLSSINGVRVRNLKHVKELIEGTTGEFVNIYLTQHNSSPISVILPLETAKASCGEIHALHNIPEFIFRNEN
eukprot:PhM_4_TR10906/c0_g1_i1/m.52730